jgi:riboflavin synthase
MFTGLIKEIGTIQSLKPQGKGLRLGVQTHQAEFKELSIDESIAINGACQTVVQCSPHYFEVDTVEETLKKTTLGRLKVGQKVNLERALQLSDRLGGHLVQGHVDTVGRIDSLQKQTTGWEFKISFPDEFQPYIVPVGSIAIDGISLTVAEVYEHSFKVAIIPYTFENTTLVEKHAGDDVNLEFDLIGKYIAKQLQWPHTPTDKQQPNKSGLSEERLKQLGYI